MTAQEYPPEFMRWCGEREWKAQARRRAIAELAVQLTQLNILSNPGEVEMLVDAVLGTAMPYLECSWRDAVLQFCWRVEGMKGDPTPPDPQYAREAVSAAVNLGFEAHWQVVEAFLWRLVPPEEKP